MENNYKNFNIGDDVTYLRKFTGVKYKGKVIEIDKDGKYLRVRNTIGNIDYLPIKEVKKMEQGGKIGDTIRIAKDMPYMTSLNNLYNKDLKIVDVKDVFFGSGNQKYYIVEVDGEQYEVPGRFTEKMATGGPVKGAKFKHDGKDFEIKKVQEGVIYTTNGKQYSLKTLESFGVKFNKERAKSNKPRGIRGERREKMEYELEDLYRDLRYAKQDLRNVKRDMEEEAGQKGDSWTDADANRYGGQMNFIEEKIESLNKKINEFEEKLSYAKGGGVGSSEYYIFEGYDHFKSKPLYKVLSKVNEYDGEWHTDKKDAELELKSLLNNPKKDSFTYSIGGL